MRTLLWFSYFWISLFCLTPSMLYTWQLNRSGQFQKRDTVVKRRVRGWMSALLRLAGVKVSVEGLELIPDGPVLFVSNHQGNFDIPILLCSLPRPYGVVAKAQLRRIPFIRIWMRYLGCVFLERDNPRKSLQALDQAAQNIQNGYSMIVFPEGTRSRGKPVGDFKAGAFRIAAKTKVPIVPICIEGSYRVMEAQGIRIRPASVSVRLFPPIDTKELSRDNWKQLPDVVQDLISEHQKKLKNDI